MRRNDPVFGMIAERRQARIPPKEGAICSKCGKHIKQNEGRRYRNKFRHYHCLPPTRLAKIKDGERLARWTREMYEDMGGDAE